MIQTRPGHSSCFKLSLPKEFGAKQRCIQLLCIERYSTSKPHKHPNKLCTCIMWPLEKDRFDPAFLHTILMMAIPSARTCPNRHSFSSWFRGFGTGDLQRMAMGPGFLFPIGRGDPGPHQNFELLDSNKAGHFISQQTFCLPNMRRPMCYQQAQSWQQSLGRVEAYSGAQNASVFSMHEQVRQTSYPGNCRARNSCDTLVSLSRML